MVIETEYSLNVDLEQFSEEPPDTELEELESQNRDNEDYLFDSDGQPNTVR
ncbi:MAG: hypothetical protein V1808_03875 [Candidatus Daviesbacteria bacterium]